MDTQINSDQVLDIPEKKTKNIKKFMLVLNCAMLVIGDCGGPLTMRLYFREGGKRVWLSSFLETSGWPFIFLPLLISYLYRRNKDGPTAKPIFISPFLFIASAILGILTGLDDYLYAYGVARIPLSTSALIIATQLGFTAGFAYVLVKQKFTAFSINSVFLLTIGAVVLAAHTSTDRPAHESDKEYYLGFFMTLAASALYGFVLPMIELAYKKAQQPITYSLVMEMQMVMSFFATAFCAVGMLVNNDFKAIPREASTFELGKSTYYIVMVCSAIMWQFFFLGAVGVIFCASSLLAGIIIATLLPVVEILAFLIYHESFQVEKGIALALSLWGSASYFYGELQQRNKEPNPPELEVLL